LVNEKTESLFDTDRGCTGHKRRFCPYETEVLPGFVCV